MCLTQKIKTKNQVSRRLVEMKKITVTEGTLSTFGCDS